MTSARITRRDRRVLVTGAIAIVAILALGKGIPALSRWQAIRVTEARESRQRRALTEAVASGLQVASDSASARSRRAEKLKSLLVRGATPDAAAAALANLVERIAAEEGLDVQSLSLKPDTTVRFELVRVRVRLNAQGDVDGLMNFLFALEAHEAMIGVHELSVTQQDAAAPTSRADALRMDVGIQALALVVPPTTKATRKT